MAVGGIPGAGPDGFFGVRFESIGGLGAHLAGQLLAEAGVLACGLNATHFSSYGSEKKGSPVRSFVRFAPADREIRRSDPVEHPQVVVVFHEALACAGPVTAGLAHDGAVLATTTVTVGELRARLGRPGGTVGALDALRIAVEESTRVNTAMLGATARMCPFLDPAAVREAIARRLGRRYPVLVEPNLRTFDRGFAEVELETLAAPSHEEVRPARQAPAFGYLEAPPGGVILEPGSSIVRDLGASREGFLPSLELGACVHCGLCDVVCPDMCFVWEDETDGSVRLRGIDYRYCKGCRKCIDACPTGALSEIREEPGWADEHRVPLYPFLDEPVGAR